MELKKRSKVINVNFLYRKVKVKIKINHKKAYLKNKKIGTQEIFPGGHNKNKRRNLFCITGYI